MKEYKTQLKNQNLKSKIKKKKEYIHAGYFNKISKEKI